MKTVITLCICVFNLLNLKAQRINIGYLNQEWLRVARYRGESNFIYPVDTSQFITLIKFSKDSVIYKGDLVYNQWPYHWKDSIRIETTEFNCLVLHSAVYKGDSLILDNHTDPQVNKREFIIYKLTADTLILGDKGSNGIVSKALYISKHPYRFSYHKCNELSPMDMSGWMVIK